MSDQKRREVLPPFVQEMRQARPNQRLALTQSSRAQSGEHDRLQTQLASLNGLTVIWPEATSHTPVSHRREEVMIRQPTMRFFHLVQTNRTWRLKSVG